VARAITASNRILKGELRGKARGFAPFSRDREFPMRAKASAADAHRNEINPKIFSASVISLHYSENSSVFLVHAHRCTLALSRLANNNHLVIINYLQRNCKL